MDIFNKTKPKSQSNLDEQKLIMDRPTAEVKFKMLIRELNDVEVQIKKGKFEDIDELKRDKNPTMNWMINRAEFLKLAIKEYIDSFKRAEITEEEIMQIKNNALEGKKSYVPFTT